MEGWIQIAELSESLQASILEALLHDAKIETHTFSTRDSAYQLMLGGVFRIYVPQEQLDDAKKITEEFFASQAEEE